MEDDDDDDDLDDLEQDSFNILYRLVEDKTPPPSPVIRPKKSASSVEARYGINIKHTVHFTYKCIFCHQKWQIHVQ